jgi:cellulose synthase/poly-beta-1,6-N-acetylglucosamine synthase-like glycosyltransferase
MDFYYLNLSRAQDLKDKKERFLYRILEILPGFLSWGTLVLTIFLSWSAPTIVAIFIILFDFYWLLRVFYLTFHQIVSFLKMKENLKIDWLEKLKNLPDWQKIYHLIILPIFKEKKEIFEESLMAILNCHYPKEKMIIVLALEERGGKEIEEMAKETEKIFSKKFGQFLITIHPQNIPGEIAGKGSNVNYSLKVVKEKIIEKTKIPPENIIVSIFDVDTKPYPHYFSCLTYHYLTTKNNLRTSYQPVPLYNNNIWEVPAFSRVVATSGTFWQMIQQERPEVLVSYSSHSIPFKVLEDVGYPNNLVSDDSRIFWKSYLYYEGDYRVLPLHYPVSMDAVLGKNLIQTIINQYRQQRRWAWGVENIPFLIFNFLKNKKISFLKKVGHTLEILEGFWSWATTSLLIFSLGWLPLLLGGKKIEITLLGYNLPRLASNLMTVAMIGMLISAILSFKLLPPVPKNQKFLKKISILLQWLLLPFTLIVFGAFPALDAQTRLMFKKYLGFWPTEKIRKNE